MKRFMPLALAVASANLAAQSLPVEHVLVSAPLQKQEAETALPVTILTGEDLRRSARSTIGDTLGDIPGLANASFGPGVGQPVIRGQQGPRVTVLQNGTSSADASSVSADHAVSVESLLADSIEVLRGPATLLYGAGAIGGVVNVIDNRIPRQRVEGMSGGAELRHDSASDMDTAVIRMDAGSGNLAFHVDGLYRDWNNLDIPGLAAREHDDDHDDEHADEEHEEHEEEAETTDGYIDNTGGRTRSLTLGSSYHFDRGLVGLAVSRLENDYGIPAGAHGDHEEEHEGEEHEGEEEHGEEEEEGGIRLEVRQTRYDAKFELAQPLPGFDSLRATVTHTDYEHAEIEGSGEVGTLYSNESWETRAELVHTEIGGFQGALGLQASVGEFSALGEEAFIPVTDSRNLGLFLIEDYRTDNWIFEAGLRVDRDERDPEAATSGKRDFNSLSLSGSAIWNISDTWQTRLYVARSERAPSIEELFSNVDGTGPEDWIEHAATAAIELGNTDLDTEVSRNIDLSLHWHTDKHDFEVTVFYNDFADYINLMNTGIEVDELPVLAYNQEDARFYGVEVNSDFTLATIAGGQVRLNVFGDSVRGELDNGDDVPRLPPRRIGGRLSWSGDALDLWTRVVDAGKQDRVGANEEPTEGYTRWDAGADYRLSVGGNELSLFLALRNLGDEEIRLSTSFLRDVAPEAGRSVEAGLRYYF
ncbi:TonB-dependent receptor [Kineobactrum sediminis]|uniref:TonB-dependent receptor n=1 Tax=Kineobactrum sediminis TaxID=1905677 RepID=A0A2N5Y5C6_9GAMM|nr:TonB-dependent receptor [Kineobactrum sediminis]PLW83579.1 TonB-dependent receptor [Kineobactrum sediminis]